MDNRVPGSFPTRSCCLYKNKTSCIKFNLQAWVCLDRTRTHRQTSRALGGAHVPPTKAKIRKLSQFDAPYFRNRTSYSKVDQARETRWPFILHSSRFAVSLPSTSLLQTAARPLPVGVATGLRSKLNSRSQRLDCLTRFQS